MEGFEHQKQGDRKEGTGYRGGNIRLPEPVSCPLLPIQLELADAAPSVSVPATDAAEAGVAVW